MKTFAELTVGDVVVVRNHSGQEVAGQVREICSEWVGAPGRGKPAHRVVKMQREDGSMGRFYPADVILEVTA